MVAHSHIMKGGKGYIFVSLALLQADNLEDIFGLLKENERLLIALSLYVVIGSVHKLVEDDRDLLLIHLYLLVIVLVEGVTLLRGLFI